MSFKVRSNGTIRVPYGVSGEWEVEVNEDGSFTYRKESEYNKAEVKGTVWIVSDIYGAKERSFPNEKEALEYKDGREQKYGMIFRMKKIFNSEGNKTLGV